MDCGAHGDEVGCDPHGSEGDLEVRSTVGHKTVYKIPGKGRYWDKYMAMHRGGYTCFSPDGRFLAVGGYYYDHSIKVWRVSDGAMVKTLPGTDQVLSLSFSPDGKFLITGHAEAGILLWDLSEGRFVRPYPVEDSSDETEDPFPEQRKWVKQLVFSGNGRSFISRTGNGTVAIRTFPAGKVVRVTKSLSMDHQISLSPDGQVHHK